MSAGELRNNDDTMTSSNDKGDEGEAPSPAVMASGKGQGHHVEGPKHPMNRDRKAVTRSLRGVWEGRFPVGQGITARKGPRPEAVLASFRKSMRPSCRSKVEAGGTCLTAWLEARPHKALRDTVRAFKVNLICKPWGPLGRTLTTS